MRHFIQALVCSSPEREKTTTKEWPSYYVEQFEILFQNCLSASRDLWPVNISHAHSAVTFVSKKILNWNFTIKMMRKQVSKDFCFALQANVSACQILNPTSPHISNQREPVPARHVFAAESSTPTFQHQYVLVALNGRHNIFHTNHISAFKKRNVNMEATASHCFWLWKKRTEKKLTSWSTWSSCCSRLCRKYSANKRCQIFVTVSRQAIIFSFNSSSVFRNAIVTSSCIGVFWEQLTAAVYPEKTESKVKQTSSLESVLKFVMKSPSLGLNPLPQLAPDKEWPENKSYWYLPGLQ